MMCCVPLLFLLFLCVQSFKEVLSRTLEEQITGFRKSEKGLQSTGNAYILLLR